MLSTWVDAAQKSANYWLCKSTSADNNECCRKIHTGSKTKTERRGAPVFTCLVELLSHDRWRVHTHFASSVDDLLAGRQPSTQLRMHKQGKLVVRFETKAAECKSSERVTADAKSSWLTSLGSLAKSVPSVSGA